MNIRLFYLALCGIGFVLTLVPRTERAVKTTEPETTFPGWPSIIHGPGLTPAALSPREEAFLRGFPGRTAAFTDDGGRWIVRWVTAPTRKLHPARHCFAGSGHRIEPGGLVRDGWEQTWGSFSAEKDGVRWTVRERITDSRGRSWTDVSAWYWSALTGPDHGPWWVLTRITPES